MAHCAKPVHTGTGTGATEHNRSILKAQAIHIQEGDDVPHN